MTLRRALDLFYLGCGMLAAVALVALAVLIMAGVLLRQVNIAFIGSDAYSGYAMAASAFLGLAYTFGRGDHIRVTLVIQRLPTALHRGAEIVCLSIGAFAAGFLAWYSVKLVWWSFVFMDMSQLNDATPLWIPQSAMALGTVALAIALLDALVRVLRGGRLEDGAGAAEGGGRSE